MQDNASHSYVFLSFTPVTLSADMDFFDPHFHVWDVSEGTASGHDASILFAQGGNPVYGAAQYEASVATGLPQELRHVGGVSLNFARCVHPTTTCVQLAGRGV